MVFGFALLAGLLIAADPSRSSLLWASPLLLVGLVVRSWAAGHLQKRVLLTVSGPFRFCRNPLYLGSFLLLLGALGAARQIVLAAVFVPVAVLVHLAVVREEERHHVELFGEAFDDYRRRVPRFIPLPGRAVASTDRWRLRRFVENGEPNAILGAAALLLFLILRAEGRV